MSVSDTYNKLSDILGAGEQIKPIKKLNAAIFSFILIIAFVFDIIGLIPGMSTILLILFTFLVKVQLMLAGYHAGITRTAASFLINAVIDLFMPLWFACTLFTITFYFFNSRAYKLQQELLNNQNIKTVGVL